MHKNFPSPRRGSWKSSQAKKQDGEKLHSKFRQGWEIDKNFHVCLIEQEDVGQLVQLQGKVWDFLL